MSAGGYVVVARNPATASENRIHADDVARQHGFRGGLVPGVTVYAYAVHEIVEAFGPEWVGTGGVHLRFRAPCYEGDRLMVTVTAPEAGSASVEVVAAGEVGGAGETRVTGTATGRSDLTMAPITSGPMPPRQARPAASEGALAPGTTLGSMPLPTDPATTTEYLATVGESSPVYDAEGWVHPGLLLEGANWVLAANVVLPPWLHVESDVRHHRAVTQGEEVEVRARVADEFGRKGHRFVALDVAWAVGSEVVASARHTAIWRLAGT